MVGIQTTKAINGLHKVTCGFWACLSCVFTPKLLLLCVLITTLPSPFLSSEGGCQSAAGCVAQCGTDFVHPPQSQFLQPLESWAPAKASLTWSAPGPLVKGVLLLRLWHKSYSLLLQSISIPSSQDFQEGLSKVQTFFLLWFIYFFPWILHCWHSSGKGFPECLGTGSIFQFWNQSIEEHR